jgi:glucose dehydrogenase
MAAKSFAGAIAGSLLMATALSSLTVCPAGAADVTSDRLLNPQREPQNWILRHGNYQGHRYPNFAGALATAGNLVFLGHLDGTFAAYDAKTLQEAWSFNSGSGIMAPPVSYSVNGKQFVAVLVGSRQPSLVLQNAPELKNTSTASMLYVFSL